MRVAPHLVHVMPFLIPTYQRTGQGKWIMTAALKLNDFIGFDRNRNLPPDKAIPRGRVISKEDCLKLCPGLDQDGLTGGAIYYDGQISNAERFVLSVCRSAAMEGADLANYIQATGLIREKNRVVGLHVIDTQTKKSFGVRAQMVVNCSGPWCGSLLRKIGIETKRELIKLIKAFVLVCRPLTQGIAVGVPSRYGVTDNDAIVNKGHRYFFITPWRERSLIGTFQIPYHGTPEQFHVDRQDVEYFVKEVQAAYPGADLSWGDINFVYGGLLPMAHSGETNVANGEGQLLKSYVVYDHEKVDGIKGLVSVVGVKFTTARDVAEKTVDLVLKKLGRAPVKSQTAWTPVYGGEVGIFDEFVSQEIKKKPKEIDLDVMHHLLKNYGAKFHEVMCYGEEDPTFLHPIAHNSFVTKAEIVHGVRTEMAQSLSDVVFRRTELGTAGFPGREALQACAGVLAQEWSWNYEEVQSQIEKVLEVYRSAGCGHWENQEKVCAS